MEPEGSLPHLQVPATCPYPSQIDLVHALTLHFLQIQLTIIFSSNPGSSKWSLSLRSPHQNPVYIFTFPHRYYKPRLSHSSWFDYPNNIWWAVQVTKLLII